MAPDIAADVVDQTTGVDLWGRVARRLRERYREHIGIGGPVAAAGRVYDMDTSSTFGDFFWHSRLRR